MWKITSSVVVRRTQDCRKKLNYQTWSPLSQCQNWPELPRSYQFLINKSWWILRMLWKVWPETGRITHYIRFRAFQEQHTAFSFIWKAHTSAHRAMFCFSVLWEHLRIYELPVLVLASIHLICRPTGSPWRGLEERRDAVEISWMSLFEFNEVISIVK